jgi:hypothetical protein
MNWKLFLFAAIVALLYVPITIVGTNTFFPQYNNFDSGCYLKYPYPVAKAPNVNPDPVETQQSDQARAQCEKDYQTAMNEYNAQKYIAIMIANVLVLLLVIFVSFNDSIRYGLFCGVAISSFIAVLMYQQTQSKLGFVVLLIVFGLCIWFINKEKDLFVKNIKKK